jgi:UDP-N-acetylmuramoylalanine-D-glutamate ligase
VTVGGNIGAPLSAQVSESTPDTFHVVETSSFQLEQIDHLSSVDRGDAEFLARSSRPPSDG